MEAIKPSSSNASVNENRRVRDSITKHSSLLTHLCPGPLELAQIDNKLSVQDYR
jgi:hypothetical protein